MERQLSCSLLGDLEGIQEVREGFALVKRREAER